MGTWRRICGIILPGSPGAQGLFGPYDRPVEGLPERVRLVIFDLDGVVYRGHEPIPGARELVAWLHAAGVAVRFATNNSMVTRAGYVERLGSMGIPTAVASSSSRA